MKALQTIIAAAALCYAANAFAQTEKQKMRPRIKPKSSDRPAAGPRLHSGW